MADHKKPPERSAISRRGFFKGVGAGTAAVSLVTGLDPESAAAAAEPALRGPGETAFTLKINGKNHQVKAEPRATLLDVLRNRLDITGAKKVCDRGTCGACTVLLDDEPVYACSILALEAEGRDLKTIEGLGSPEQLSQVMKAFVENDAQQCGFCTPGFILACTAFLARHPDPTLEEIQQGLGGNLCRCGTYPGITQAMVDAAKALKGGA